jgi:hypothetical protein
VNRCDPGRYVPVVSELWRHEIRRGGRGVLMLPPVAAVACALLAPAVDGFAARVLAADAIPVVAGLAAAAIVAGERAAELQLTMPVPYPVTVARRLGLLAASTLAATVLLTVALGERGTLAEPWPVAAGIAGFSLALIAVGAVAAAPSRSGGGASAVVFAAWLAKVMIVDPALHSTAIQTVLLVGVAAVLFHRVRRVLADDEHQLRAEAS